MASLQGLARTAQQGLNATNLAYAQQEPMLAYLDRNRREREEEKSKQMLREVEAQALLQQQEMARQQMAMQQQQALTGKPLEPKEQRMQDLLMSFKQEGLTIEKGDPPELVIEKMQSQAALAAEAGFPDLSNSIYTNIEKRMGSIPGERPMTRSETESLSQADLRTAQAGAARGQARVANQYASQNEAVGRGTQRRPQATTEFIDSVSLELDLIADETTDTGWKSYFTRLGTDERKLIADRAFQIIESGRAQGNNIEIRTATIAAYQSYKAQLEEMERNANQSTPTNIPNRNQRGMNSGPSAAERLLDSQYGQ